jgi:hypothetical protein
VKKLTTFKAQSRVYGTPVRAAAAQIGGVIAAAVIGMLIPVAPSMAIATAAFVAIYVLLAFLFPSRISVGSDGVLLEWLGRRTFFPRAELRRARVEMSRFVSMTALVLEREDAPDVEIVMSESAAMAHLVNEMLHDEEDSATADSLPREAVLVHLTRTAGATRDWLRVLRERGFAETSHRIAAVPSEALLRVVEDGAARPLDRTAAAVALTGNEVDESIRARIRVAVETVVEPKLRVALTRSLETDDDMALLEEAVDDLTDRSSAAFDHSDGS